MSQQEESDEQTETTYEDELVGDKIFTVCLDSYV